MDRIEGETLQNPPGYEVDFDLLKQFEREFDLKNPEGCRIPCRVLGYGEMSIVVEIKEQNMQGLAFKMMPIFETWDEIGDYLETFIEYNRKLEQDIGINMPLNGYAVFESRLGKPVFFIIQEKFKPSTIGNQVIHMIPVEMVEVLVKQTLNELKKVWDFNNSNSDWDVGIDGQISNWVTEDFNPDNPEISPDCCLSYVDTSTPLLRIKGEEQLDTELFLRAAPSMLAWILRVFFVQEVTDRYYDFRQVAVDLLANFYKEQRPELIPRLVGAANDFFDSECAEFGIEPIEVKELRSYYREDAFIWSLYLNMRRLDRWLYRDILHKEYRYPIPPKVKR